MNLGFFKFVPVLNCLKRKSIKIRPGDDMVIFQIKPPRSCTRIHPTAAAQVLLSFFGEYLFEIMNLYVKHVVVLTPFLGLR